MKIAKSLAAAAVLAAAAFGTSAQAADVSSPVQGVAIWEGGENFFGSSWLALNSDAGDTFTNRFVFSITGAPSDLSAFVGSTNPLATSGLDISNLSLYSGAGDLLTTGTATSTGAFDLWQLSAAALATGNYYLQVSGTVVGNTGGAFAGSVALNPVPEPETYGMMLAGLGVLGFLARRRKAANQ